MQSVASRTPSGSALGPTICGTSISASSAGKSMAELAEMLVPQMVGPSALPEGVRLATLCMSQVPASTYRRALEALVTFDRRANLAQVQVPTLVLAGEHDRNAPPAVMKKMAQSIPHSTYQEMRGVGHLQ